MNQEILQEAAKVTSEVSVKLATPGLTTEDLRSLIRILGIVQEALDGAIAVDAFMYAIEMKKFNSSFVSDLNDHDYEDDGTSVHHCSICGDPESLHNQGEIQ